MYIPFHITKKTSKEINVKETKRNITANTTLMNKIHNISVKNNLIRIGHNNLFKYFSYLFFTQHQSQYVSLCITKKTIFPFIIQQYFSSEETQSGNSIVS